MHKSSSFQWLCPFCSLIFLFFFCTTDNSTNLGGKIINDKYPHFRGYVMNSSDLDTVPFSVPRAGDSGFGIHEVSGSQMLIGADSGEYAAGFVRFPCLPDTNSSRRYSSNDTLRSIVLRFWNDTATTSFPLQIWRSDFALHADSPSAANGDILLDSLQIAFSDTLNALDSVVLLPGAFGGLADSIFFARTTSNKASAAAATFKDTFGFIIANPNPSAGVIRMFGNPQLAVKFKQGNDTTPDINYGSTHTSYYVAKQQSPGSVSQPISYASKKTLVFRFNATRLWASIDSFPPASGPDTAQIIAAFFPLYRPGAVDTISLRYILLDSLVHDGRVLDTLFARPPSPPGVVTLYQNDTVEANAAQSVEIINLLENQRRALPLNPKLFLYLRLSEDVNQIWRKSNYSTIPFLNVTAASN